MLTEIVRWSREHPRIFVRNLVITSAVGVFARLVRLPAAHVAGCWTPPGHPGAHTGNMWTPWISSLNYCFTFCALAFLETQEISSCITSILGCSCQPCVTLLHKDTWGVMTAPYSWAKWKFGHTLALVHAPPPPIHRDCHPVTCLYRTAERFTSFR